MRMCEFNVAVRPDPVEEKTKGGLILTADTKDMEKHRGVKGTVTHMAAKAFDEWPESAPKVGDRVLFAKHAGVFFTIGADEFRFLKDKDVMAILEEGDE